MTDIRDILNKVINNELSVDDAEVMLKAAPFEDLGFAHVDTHRRLRQGVGEVIYGAGKTADQIVSISNKLLEAGESRVLVTRIDKDKARIIANNLPLKYYETASIGIIGELPINRTKNKIVIATGGTSDINVAEEAALTCECFGNTVVRLYDVGVAGLHRLLSHKEEIISASVIIAIAGMEGALASVIGGLASCPVIAVPTSVGYGSNFNGLSALLSMLNSCSAGVSVVNIDNGFGAGYIASLINHRGDKE